LSETIDQIVAALNFILDSSPKGTKLILENAAGQAGTVGQSFEELAQIISRIGDKPKIGICLDTQHAFASGYELDKVLDKFDKVVGLKHLTVVHLNDSKTEFASRVDRHENLGSGKIGLEKLKQFISDKRLANIPIILEVPGKDGSGPGKIDMLQLKHLVGQD
jgi:apurinic endonuclease APN1